MGSITGYFDELEQYHRKEYKDKIRRFESMLEDTSKHSYDYVLAVKDVKELLNKVVNNIFSDEAIVKSGKESDLLENIDCIQKKFNFGQQPTAYWVYIWFIPESMSTSISKLTVLYWIRPNLESE